MVDDKRMIVAVDHATNEPPVIIIGTYDEMLTGQILIVPDSVVQAWLQQLFNNFQLEIGPLEPEGDELRYEARFVPRVAQTGEPPKGGTDES